MSFERRDNSGALFNNKNNPKAKSEYGGQATINGVEYWISAWIKDGSQGKFFSLTFRPKNEKVEPRQKSWGEELDDDIPL